MITPQQQKLMSDLQWGYLLQFRKLIYSRCKKLPKSYREDASIREDFVQHCYLGALIILKNPKINDTDSAIVDWIANYAKKEFIRTYNKEKTAKVPLSVATLPFPIANPNRRENPYYRKKVKYAQKGNVDLERISSGDMVASDMFYELIDPSDSWPYTKNGVPGYYTTREMREVGFKPYWQMPDPRIWAIGLRDRLSPKAAFLLETCIQHKTTHQQKLVEILSEQPKWSLRTVKVYWKEIVEAYEQISREQAAELRNATR